VFDLVEAIVRIAVEPDARFARPFFLLSSSGLAGISATFQSSAFAPALFSGGEGGRRSDEGALDSAPMFPNGSLGFQTGENFVPVVC
jgi:hypothetical protein